jgi:hypothetical protein
MVYYVFPIYIYVWIATLVCWLLLRWCILQKLQRIREPTLESQESSTSDWETWWNAFCWYPLIASSTALKNWNYFNAWFSASIAKRGVYRAPLPHRILGGRHHATTDSESQKREGGGGEETVAARVEKWWRSRGQCGQWCKAVGASPSHRAAD